jgi:dienelactone hydrolase
VAAGCTTLLAGGEGQLERTWQAARVWVPGAALPTPQPVPLTGRLDALTPRLDRLPATSSVPVVVYAHDCNGLGPELAVWADRLARHGYAVIAPDGFARSGRASVCEPGDVDALLTREAEIRYALRQVRAQSWVRQRAVFLLGVGQGATIAARGAVGAVTGTVIIGGAGESRRPSPALVREGGGASAPPSEDDQRAVVDFLQRLTPR